MKKLLLSILVGLTAFPVAYANDNMANLKVRIAGALQGNAYFLCFYGSGCYSMRAGAKGRSFPINPSVLANQKKIFITDIRTRKIYAQPITDACAVKLAGAQTVTVSGNLQVNNAVPVIQNLECIVT